MVQDHPLHRIPLPLLGSRSIVGSVSETATPPFPRIPWGTRACWRSPNRSASPEKPSRERTGKCEVLRAMAPFAASRGWCPSFKRPTAVFASAALMTAPPIPLQEIRAEGGMRRQSSTRISIGLSGAHTSRRKAGGKITRIYAIPRSRLSLLGSKPMTISPSISVTGVVA